MESREREEDELQALQMHRLPHRSPVTPQTGCVDRARGEPKTKTESTHRDGVQPQNLGSSASPKLGQRKEEGKMLDCQDPET